MDRAMASHLRALDTYDGSGLPLLPLSASARTLGLDGLAFTLTPGGHTAELLQTAGRLTADLEDLQLVQGQGPSIDAARHPELVLISNLAVAADRWPGLDSSLAELGVQAIFAFPVRIGVIALGVLTGHRTRPGPLTADQLIDALALADAVASLLIRLIASATGSTILDSEGSHLYFAEVHQAVGVLTAQLRVTPADALVRLRAHACTHNRSLLHTARDVLHHRIRLSADNDPPDT